jgi:drug/metabolite transporter (DMT)-like permease
MPPAVETPETTTAGPAISRRAHGRVYALLLVMVLTWSFNFVIAKFALREMSGLMVASLRTTLSGLFILPIFLWRNRRVHRTWPRRDLAVLLALGILGVIGNQVLFVLGLARTSVAHAAVIVALSPLAALLMAAIAGQERIDARKVAGMAVAICGVLALQAGRAAGRGPSLAGDLIMLSSACVFAAFAVYGKTVTARYGSLTVNTFAYAGGGLAMLPLTVWLASRFDLSRVSLAAWLSVAYMAVFPAVIAYLIFYYALQHLPASRVTAFAYFQPVLATVLAALLLGERPGIGFASGGALVLLGVFLTERR